MKMGMMMIVIVIGLDVSRARLRLSENVPTSCGVHDMHMATWIVTALCCLPRQVSAWISLNMLRRSGCTLPVEMWFPIAELPTPELEEELVAQGRT